MSQKSTVSGAQVDDIDGLEALNLRRLSLFRNLLPDLEALLVTVQAFPQLESLDLGGNPCFQDAAQRHGVVRALPGLKELDGEVLTSVDRQLAIEFFACAEEAGLEGRPGTSCGLRPKTAPVHAARAPDAPVRGRERSSSRRSRGSARSPSCGSPITDNVESIARFQDYVQALQLRLQTTQVECENLTRQIQTLRQEGLVFGGVCSRFGFRDPLKQDLRKFPANASRFRRCGDHF